MLLGMEVGLDPGDILLDGDTALSKRGTAPHFSAHVYCGQTLGWIKVPVGTEVDLGPGNIVLDWDPALPKGAQQPTFSVHVYFGQTVAYLSQ